MTPEEKLAAIEQILGLVPATPPPDPFPEWPRPEEFSDEQDAVNRMFFYNRGLIITRARLGYTFAGNRARYGANLSAAWDQVDAEKSGPTEWAKKKGWDKHPFDMVALGILTRVPGFELPSEVEPLMPPTFPSLPEGMGMDEYVCENIYRDGTPGGGE